MPGHNSRCCLPVMHACTCVSVIWAVHVQVLGRTIACQISSACHACMFVCECDMGSARAGVWQDHSMPDIVCLSCMHLCECDMGSARAGVWQDHSMPDIFCLSCMHLCECDMGSACAGVWQDHGVQGCGCGQQSGTPGQPGRGNHGRDPGQQEGGLQRRLPRPQQVCVVQRILLKYTSYGQGGMFCCFMPPPVIGH